MSPWRALAAASAGIFPARILVLIEAALLLPLFWFAGPGAAAEGRFLLAAAQCLSEEIAVWGRNTETAVARLSRGELAIPIDISPHRVAGPAGEK